ncbi:hypothetical protein [Novosphingobium sp. AP12]|uniref:hypothetical protein n=1 Tax=Novosphingobium sp. AP12 TaxID=1144305 RepID=UPI000271ECAC|nr:hypothetical protein [Novosphingobium sp. AP12]EJL26619.1 hypothetical protein PMI02_02964 [Novosphingobium sp. AP12]
MRTLLIAALWLTPLWFASWFTVSYSADIAYEFGAWWAYLAFTPLFLAVSAAVTLFPFMLIQRLVKIQRQH